MLGTLPKRSKFIPSVDLYSSCRPSRLSPIRQLASSSIKRALFTSRISKQFGNLRRAASCHSFGRESVVVTYTNSLSIKTVTCLVLISVTTHKSGSAMFRKMNILARRSLTSLSQRTTRHVGQVCGWTARATCFSLSKTITLRSRRSFCVVAQTVRSQRSPAAVMEVEHGKGTSASFGSVSVIFITNGRDDLFD